MLDALFVIRALASGALKEAGKEFWGLGTWAAMS
jgi:hypothetical protein